jgi:hypothetical protein
MKKTSAALINVTTPSHILPSALPVASTESIETIIKPRPQTAVASTEKRDNKAAAAVS